MSLSASLSASAALCLTPLPLPLPSPPSPPLLHLPHSLSLSFPTTLTLSLPSLFNVLFKWLGHCRQTEIKRGGKWTVNGQRERQWTIEKWHNKRHMRQEDGRDIMVMDVQKPLLKRNYFVTNFIVRSDKEKRPKWKDWWWWWEGVHLDCASQYSNQCSTNEICSNQRKPIKAVVIKDTLFISGLIPNCPFFKVLTPDCPLPIPSPQWTRQVGGLER